ncbi:MAG: homoserine acetyltransferase [Flavobacteria bacterium RIFCSPLOWO2_12_FULL_35_11]|nr:MAG: homoserine acetyltransferase [Flavobacteria bacterium RIFCSPLOWO2_12_FULL_35_11]
MNSLKYITVPNFASEDGKITADVTLSYQVFGKELHSVPVVLINHALTGNSDVAGEFGWWKSIVGDSKLIDTKKYTVLAFDIPGNGYKTTEILFEYDAFSARDIANLFGLAVQQLEILSLYAAIGSSLGGGIAWEMAILFPNLIENLIPVASDWKASDWILGHNKVQFQILENSKKPLHDARMMAMLFYRSPASFQSRFNRTVNSNLGMYNIESWLQHHGKKLEGRFTLHAYKVMTHLLSSVDISKKFAGIEEAFEQMKSKVIMIGIDSDLFFVAEDNKETAKLLDQQNKKVDYKEIKSIHGHDAFLIEFEQLVEALSDVFKYKL